MNMNRSARLLWPLMILHTSAFALDVTSRIDAVAVYPSGAVVTRVASVALPAGTSTIRLTGLVNDLDPEQIRLQAVAANVELGQIRIDREEQRDAFNAEIDSLNTEIAALQERIASIDDAVKSAELRLKFLDGLAAGYSKEAWHGSAQGTADINSWRQALALLESASGDAYATVREQKAARTAAERELSLLQRNLASKRGGALSSTVLEVSLRAASATSTELRLDYFQDDASWRSQYEARLDSNAGTLRLTQQAVIEQGTDESWSNVMLSLSTSDPSGDLEPGSLDPEFLDIYEPPAPSAPARSRLQQLGAMADSMEEMLVASEKVTSRVGNYAVTYDVPGRVSVSNNSDETQSFDVTAFDTAVKLVTRIVPRNGDQAYLAARFLYDGSVPLYESGLRVYVDGAYAGASTMPTALPQTEVTVPMGQDRRVEVKVVDQGDVTGRGGIVSRRKTETTNYIFEIANRRQSETLVEVVDRYPVPRNKDIEVDVARNSTAPTETSFNDQPGVILWRKALEPNESWRIQHQYTVTYPADKVLSRQ
ncbi:mucoidy inhibitor MuiA family protein [Woeseia oceani]|uniref:DUF4139 domain-containing protein n=1 Tax=Woeseia oceani TaxID=1548547 RepID=A0A193LFC9_9GAMM|nr:mucoidy inhibitor MuiA family protein [Woeseia oceani]ANO51161.1 hypothetical protein BA177_08040 [Woeseia oceani]